jgi:hypothetical protein
MAYLTWVHDIYSVGVFRGNERTGFSEKSEVVVGVSQEEEKG